MKNKTNLYVFMLIVMLLVQANFLYANWLEHAVLTASDGAAYDIFGHSVSINGDYAIIGAACDDDKGTNSGSAYFFRYDGANWSQQQKLTASDGAVNDWFGYAVSISGDYAIAGAHYDDVNGTDSGSAYIFKRGAAAWSQQAKLFPSDGAAYDWFGYAVSISGDYAIVGAYYDDDKADASGSAYIFKRDGTNWNEQEKLIALDGAADDRFGYSVSISGNYAIVGVPYDDDKGANSGSAYIFKYDGNDWSQQQKLLASDGAASDSFGWSVSISGESAIVGALYDDDKGTNSGSAYIFKCDGNTWAHQQKLTASDGAADDVFGCSVSISDDYVIVGSVGDDDRGSLSGSAYIFKRDGTTWSQQDKLIALDGAAGDDFGYAVSVSGNTAIIGADYNDDKGTDSGSAYIFMYCPRADLNDDCKVDFTDLAVFADSWLYGTD